LESFFAVGGLADEEFVEVDAESSRPLGVECMLGVNEGGDATFFLSAGDGVEGERCFAAGFGAEEFEDTTAGEAAATERRSRESEPVEIPGKPPIFSVASSFMMDPLPNIFSICPTVFSSRTWCSFWGFAGVFFAGLAAMN
jgi:hypothetical protein